MSNIFKLCRKQYYWLEASVFCTSFAMAVHVGMILAAILIGLANPNVYIIFSAISIFMALLSRWGYRIALSRATATATMEMKKQVNSQLDISNEIARVKEVLFSREATDKYDVILTENVDVSRNKELKLKLLMISRNISDAMEKPVEIYCNGIRIC